MSKQEKSRKCYYCGGAEKHAPGCNERPVVKEITTAEIDAKIVKDVEQRKQAAEAIRKAAQESITEEQAKVLLQEFHAGTERLKAVWVPVCYPAGHTYTPDQMVERKPVQITRLKFKDP